MPTRLVSAHDRAGLMTGANFTRGISFAYRIERNPVADRASRITNGWGWNCKVHVSLS